MKVDRIIRVIASICFILLILALVITRNSPATGYEASIYPATPSIFWVALFLSVVCGISIVVHQVHAKGQAKSNLWIVGFLIIFLACASLSSLWIIRGYALWTPGDPLTHLGKIQNIIASGHAGGDNFYPIAHIYLAEISSVSGITAVETHKYVPFIFYLLQLVFIYLLAKSILPSKGAIILAAIASTAFLHGWYLALSPNHLSNLAFPLAFFLLVKRAFPGTALWKSLFLIVASIYAPFHPIPVFALLLLLLTIWLPDKILGISKKATSTAMRSTFSYSIPASLFVFVWGITWISSFWVWEDTIRNVNTLLTEQGVSNLRVLEERIRYGQEHGYSALEMFLKHYGGILVYIILALAAFPIVYKKAISGNGTINLLSLYGPLVVFGLAIVLLYFLNIGFSPARILIYVVLICTILTGFMLYEILEKGRPSNHNNYKHALAPLLVIFILSATFASGALKLYPSRYILHENWHITQTEIDGMDWFFHNKDTTKPITGMMMASARFADFLLTPEERVKHEYVGLELLRREGGQQGEMLWHFGYEEHTQLGEWYEQIAYLVLIPADRVLYQEIYPEMQDIRFLPEDFRRLEQDHSVDKLYTNSGLDIYYVTPSPLPT